MAYAGSAGYYQDSLASRKFEPKYDVAGNGERQPGSAWKPILYASAFDTGKLTPGSLLLDITTEFDRGQNWAPRDADQLERGPVLVRKALQYSLKHPGDPGPPARTGSEAVDKTGPQRWACASRAASEAYLQAGLAGALGTVEVRPLDLTSAYGTLANDGVRVPPRMILGRRSLPDDLAVGPFDGEDHPRRDVDAAVRERAVGRGQVERPDLDRAERSGQARLEEGLVAAGEAEAHRLRRRPRPASLPTR